MGLGRKLFYLMLWREDDEVGEKVFGEMQMLGGIRVGAREENS